MILGVAVALLLVGCGGGGDHAVANPLGGSDNEEFLATMSDGTPMGIEIYKDTKGEWDGIFMVLTSTGPLADQVGSFDGTIDANGNISAACETDAGGLFTLSGKATDTGLTLVRSDYADQTLQFAPVASTVPKARETVAFNVMFRYVWETLVPSTVTLNTTPTMSFLGAKAYRGTFVNAQQKSYSRVCDFFTFSSSQRRGAFGA